MTTEEKRLSVATVCLLVEGDKVLLPRKKRNIGAGFRNGYGGGVEAGETPRIAATRELLEESGVKARPEDLEFVAILTLHNHPKTGEPFTCKVYVFLVRRWQGEPVETEEMGRPEWFYFHDLPINDLLPADALWMPRVLLHGQILVFEGSYGPRQRELIGEFNIMKMPYFTEDSNL